MRKSISDLQNALQHEFETTLSSPVNSVAKEALRLLIPPGYSPSVELRENGRKKRCNASAESWSPKSGEIVIRCILGDPVSSFHPSSEPVPSHEIKMPTLVDVTPEQVRELCAVLANEERAGRSFIALKWFRDSVLAGKGFDWARSPETRQAVLATAIEQGAVITRKILNPRAPQFPTTTIALSRSHEPSQGPELRRYVPVPVKGEPLSTTLLRDRGVR